MSEDDIDALRGADSEIGAAMGKLEDASDDCAPANDAYDLLERAQEIIGTALAKARGGSDD